MKLKFIGTDGHSADDAINRIYSLSEVGAVDV